MIRNVRGSGTLVPEDIRWITATTAGRVERLVLRPGATVKPDSVILELSNPDLKQAASNAELAWKSAIAQYENAKASCAARGWDRRMPSRTRSRSSTSIRRTSTPTGSWRTRAW
jgi:multidrug efflux pump subunit AcrA (membrane-fusion protein)